MRELLEPKRQRLQQAEIVPLHSGLDNRVRHSLKKKEIINSFEDYYRNTGQI